MGDNNNWDGGLGVGMEDGMSEMTGHEKPEGEGWRECFADMLAVMDDEQLIRFRHRLGKMGRERTVRILTLEIAERELKLRKAAE